MATRNAIKAADGQYQDFTITAVEEHEKSSTITCDGWCFGVPKSWGTPKVGQAARFWGRGFGYTVRGLDIDGSEVFYRTHEEQEEKERQELVDMEEKNKSEYEKKREDYDKRVASLPQVFRVRMEKFRKRGNKWRYEYEPYELFCLEEAVKIAAALKTKEAIDAFRKLGYEEQRKLVDLDDGHSGNTFGFACLMATAYLEDETLVPRMHGAITPLVGCEEFGCH